MSKYYILSRKVSRATSRALHSSAVQQTQGTVDIYLPIYQGTVLLYSLTLMLPPPKRFSRAPFLARFWKLHTIVQRRACTGGVYLQAWCHMHMHMHMRAVGRVGATPAVGRVARARFARLRVLGEGAAELIHEAWDDAIWRTRAAGPRVGRAGQGCRRGCRAGEGAQVGADCRTAGPHSHRRCRPWVCVARAGAMRAHESGPRYRIQSGRGR